MAATEPQPEAFRVLIDRPTLLQRIAELAREVRAAFPAEPPCLVAVMDGARVFATELARHLPGFPAAHAVRASSYGHGTQSSGQVLLAASAIPVEGRPVVILEDIVDTGRTIDKLRTWLLAHGAVEVRVCTLLSKPSRRVVAVALDWVGFEIPDEFVIGFGMDVDGRYRDLPHVAVYR